MAIDDTRSVKLFYSYSHTDKKLRDELAKHSSSGYILGWHDRDIVAGMDWAREIDTYLNSADIIVLLVSADFLASKYCRGIEMRRAMERYSAGEAIVIPVILRAVRWQDEPFGSLQALPTNSKAVTSWVSQDEAFLDVANGIHRAIEQVLKKREETKKNYLDEARRYTVEGKLEEAYTTYSTALQLFPDDGALYRSMGDFLFAQKRYLDAVSVYDHAIHLNYKHLQVFVNKGKALEYLQRFDEAAGAYQSAIKLSDSDFSLYRSLGNVRFRGEHFREALEAFDRFMKLSPRRDAELFTMRGDAFSMLASYQEALDEYEKALELAPGNASLHDSKGLMLSALQRYSEAIDAYRKAIGLDGGNAEFWRNMAAAFDAMAATDKQSLEAAYQIYLKAYQAYQEAIKRDPHNAFLHKEKGDALVKMDDLPGALTAYTDAIRLNNTVRSFYLARSEVHKRMAEENFDLYKRRLRFAQEDLEAAQRQDPPGENN